MIRYSIRDLIWLVLAVSLPVAWWADRKRQDEARAELLGAQSRLTDENRKLIAENKKFRLRELEANTLMDPASGRQRIRQRLSAKAD